LEERRSLKNDLLIEVWGLTISLFLSSIVMPSVFFCIRSIFKFPKFRFSRTLSFWNFSLVFIYRRKTKWQLLIIN
jgi:hypothetical protein